MTVDVEYKLYKHRAMIVFLRLKMLCFPLLSPAFQNESYVQMHLESILQNLEIPKGCIEITIGQKKYYFIGICL